MVVRNLCEKGGQDVYKMCETGQEDELEEREKSDPRDIYIRMPLDMYLGHLSPIEMVLPILDRKYSIIVRR